jgi:ABC-2 type transport system permease protein
MMSFSRLMEVYRAHSKVTMYRYLQYRVELVIWLLSMILGPVVFLVVWSTIAASNNGSIGDLSRGEIAAYFIAEMLLNHITFAWVMWEWEARVQSGQLSYVLVRPSHIFHKDLAENITYKTATFPVMFLTAIVLVIAFQPVINVVPWALITFVPVLLLAFALRFLVDWTLAIGSFWVTEVDGLNGFYFFGLLFLSGKMGPLSLMPEPIQYLSYVFPFRWMIGFPLDLLLGKLTPTETIIGILAQLGWIAFMVVVVQVIWKAGVRRYTAVGG